MKNMKKVLAILLAASMLMLTAACGTTETADEVVTTPEQTETTTETATAATETETAAEVVVEDTRAISEKYPDAHVISLSADGSVTYDGETVEEFDYTWHADPSVDHDEVKNCPAEYYTGTEPETDAAVYVAHDIYYYPELDESGFKQVFYDDETEWCYYYTAEGYEDYIFATLPGRSSLPTEMMHSEEDAYANPVVHITQPGQYVLEGEWNGQIWIDLGDKDETFVDESAKVTIILNDVDVTCTVAPALVFYSVYECDNTWEDREEYTAEADLTNAGANVIICDGTENNFTGTNVYRMLKAKFKDEDVSYEGQAQKKARKTDAAFYSYESMNIDGEEGGTGVLNVTAGFEGLDTELHLAINGGNINIFSQDDGINVNEDGVSVVAFNGGTVHILGGLGSEGDGVDSNGFLVVNGGSVFASANPASDSGLDSDGGSYIYGGTVLALGSTMDWAESDGTDTTQAVMNLRFSSFENADEDIEIKDADGNTVFSYVPENDSVIGGNARRYQGAIISAPSLSVGDTYTVYVGGVQQGYGDTAELGGFGGMGGGMGFGGGMDFGGFDTSMTIGELKELLEDADDDQTVMDFLMEQNGMDSDFDPAQMGQGGTAPEMPTGGQGFDPNSQSGGQGGQTPPEMPTGSQGFDPNAQGSGSESAGSGEGGNAPQMPGGQGFDPNSQSSGTGSESGASGLNPDFVLEDTVNGFTGVADYE